VRRSASNPAVLTQKRPQNDSSCYVPGIVAQNQRLCLSVREVAARFLGFNSSMERSMARRNRTINLPAPYLRRVLARSIAHRRPRAYPFCLPFLRDDFELSFDRPITIIAGVKRTGKSTLLEGIAGARGYDEAGAARVTAGRSFRATEVMGGELSEAFAGRAGFRKLPRAGSSGQRVSFRSRDTLTSQQSIRGLPLALLTAKAFLRFFEERCQKQASSSSMNRKPRCRPRARWNF